jgi:hypothetical protein
MLLSFDFVFPTHIAIIRMNGLEDEPICMLSRDPAEQTGGRVERGTVIGRKH